MQASRERDLKLVCVYERSIEAFEKASAEDRNISLLSFAIEKRSSAMEENCNAKNVEKR